MLVSSYVRDIAQYEMRRGVRFAGADVNFIVNDLLLALAVALVVALAVGSSR